MNFTDTLIVRISDHFQIDFKLYIAACEAWLKQQCNQYNFTESKNGVSYSYIPDQISTSKAVGDVLRLFFGEDVEFPGEGEAIPYLLTRLCAQALDPAEIAIRYDPEKCSALIDKHGIHITLSQDRMNATCYHNTELHINENSGVWKLTIHGCWGGRDDGLGPTHYPEEHKYRGEIQGTRNGLSLTTLSGKKPFEAFKLWNIDVPQLPMRQTT